jgi:hypothetical protein
MAWEQNGNAINANQWLGTRNPLPLMIRTNNSGQAVGAQPPLDDQEAMRITPFQPGAAPLQRGRVGIWTDAPNRALHVQGTEIHSGGGGAGYSFENRETAAFVEIPANGERWVWYASGGIARLWSGSDKLAVTPGGNVRIGTPPPGSNYKLDVVGSINATDIHKNGAPLVGSQWTNGTGGISYTDGKVGIGTTTPRQKLSVLSRSLSFGEGILTAANLDRTGDAVAISGILGDSGSSLGTGGPVGVLGIVDSGAEATAKAIFGWTADFSRQYAGFFSGRGWFGGNVGIGIGAETPGFRLDVAGQAHATSFPTSSDARLKTNVKRLTNVLDKLEKIRAVSFDWNELCESLGRSTGRTEIGVIGQEVEAVFPELVTAWGDESYEAVDYGRLTGILIEAVKELKAQNEVLRSRIEALEGA